MKKLIIEFLGTMFLVLVIGVSGNPLAIGAILMVMIYMGGHISGAHFNPAVTTAVLLRGKIAAKEAMQYWVAQIVGGLVGAAVAHWLKDGPTNVVVADGMWMEAIAGELLFTFALASVVLNVATSNETSGNSFYGLAIGFTVFAGAMTVGAISGGAFNPAVSISHNLMALNFNDLGAGNWCDMLLHIVCALVGGAVAASVYKMTNSD